MWNTISSGQTWRGTFVNTRKNGTTYTEEASISPIHDEHGNIVNYVAAKRDVSQQLSLEEQLRQAQRLESVGRLAGGVAHDFNNMLSVILGHAELALEQLEESHPLREEVEPIVEASQRSRELTRQLLAFARQQTVAPEVLNLNDTIETLLGMLRRLIGENIDLQWNPGEGLWPVRIDPAQIDQILANLVVNARDAIEGAGAILIDTRNAELDEAYSEQHAGFHPGRYVVLVVSDDGKGMDKETRATIFEPFFTTKMQGEGTGLGLATVYGIVKQNEGFINVYSEPGKGSTFRIYFPAYEHESLPREAVRTGEAPETGTETILLVEDEGHLLEFTRRRLDRLGYRVLSADNPNTAIDMAQNHDGAIDLLLTDVVMPEMSGKDLLEKLRKVRPGLKCLYMSGYPANVIAHQGVLEEDVHFLHKPFSTADFAAKVREALEN